MRKRYVLCGASARGYVLYARALMGSLKGSGELVGIFDSNGMRAEYVRDQVDPARQMPVFTDFDAMLRQTKPDCVIIATMDSSHHTYTTRALDAGCDVICEKPMTVTAGQAKNILEAEKRNARRIIVPLNCRYTPVYMKIKELIAGGAVGKVLSVDLQWLLDRIHGADYFRRWHKWMENSGGLLVTKATHHFDLVNWWIDQDPQTVYANGSLDFYGPNQPAYATHCRVCPAYDKCDLAMEGFGDVSGTDMSFMEGMYFGPEKEDGYIRDQCVFAPCDIYDNMSLSVRYSGGALLTYSLNAYMPWEGWNVAINGTKGRLQATSVHRGFGGDVTHDTIELHYPDGSKVTHAVKRGAGVHEDSDEQMLRRLLSDDPGQDPLQQTAGSRDGALSTLIGAAANRSIETGEAVHIADMLDIDAYWPQTL